MLSSRGKMYLKIELICFQVQWSPNVWDRIEDLCIHFEIILKIWGFSHMDLFYSSGLGHLQPLFKCFKLDCDSSFQQSIAY